MNKGWSKLSIILHWLIVVLVFVSLFMAEGTGWALLQRDTGKPYDTSVWFTHLIPGLIVLLFAMVRMWDLYTRGRPPYPESSAPWMTLLAKTVHISLWLALIGYPLSGAVAWFAEIRTIGKLHALMLLPMLALIGLHVSGALYQHFIAKTKVLRRMFVPGSE